MRPICDAARFAALVALLVTLGTSPATAGSLRGHASLEPALDGNLPRTAPSLHHAAFTIDTQTRLAIFAWQNFIAVMWPSLADGHGEPYEPDDPVVFGHYDARFRPAWMRWKTTFDLYPQNGSEPPPWDQPSAHAVCRHVPADDSRPRLIMTDGFDRLASETAAPFAGPLWDPAGLHADLRMNRVEYDYVRSHGYYDRNNWPAHGEPPIRFPAGTAGRPGAIEVEAAWRNLAELPPEFHSRMFTSDALAVEPGTCSADGYGRIRCDCEPIQAALVRFHIAHKTAEFPQWIGATFGQVDQIGDAAATPSDRFAAPAGAESCAVRASPHTVRTRHPESHDIPGPNDQDAPPTDAKRIPAMAGTPARTTTAAVNARYRQRLRGTVWQHYVLIGTQWPTAPPVPPAQLNDDTHCVRDLRPLTNPIDAPLVER